MTHDDVKKALIKVLDKVQSTSGLPTSPLYGTDVPSKTLEQFDSTMWPAATSWLAKELDVVIPNDVHVFGGKNGGPLLTIDATCKLVLEKHQKKPALAIAAE